MSDKDKDKKVESTNYTLPIIFSVLTVLGLIAFYIYFKVDHGTKDSQINRGKSAMSIYYSILNPDPNPNPNPKL